MSLDGVVIEARPFGPKRERLPEEGIQRHGAEEPNDEATNSSWDDDICDRDPSCDEQIDGDCSH